MGSAVGRFFNTFFDIEPHERLKLFLLTLTFFLIIAAYTLTKELKDIIFAATVGKSYIPLAKLLTLFILVPSILLYSKLVDKLRRYHLLCLYALAYGVLGIIFTFLLGDPVIGLGNPVLSPYRMFGWIQYFLLEGFSPFIVGVFWAFANSITDPAEAKKNYGFMVSGSKLGGILSAGLAWIVLTQETPLFGLISSDIAKHQLLLGLSSLLLILVPFVILLLVRNVSGKYLHGYEAAYRLEKQRSRKGESQTGMFSGLWMFVKYPYILGVFCMVFFYEVINSVLSYERIGIAQASSESIAGVSSFLFKIMLLTHFTGFLISFLGTKQLLRVLGERLCLILIPVVTGGLLLYFTISYTPSALIVAFVIMRAINYGFSYPVRESLYIPTIKEIKFKSKSWIDAFGTKFAKSTGSAFNLLAEKLGPTLASTAHTAFFAVIIGIWIVAAMLLGKRFDKAVANNEVIGADSQEPDEAKS